MKSKVPHDKNTISLDAEYNIAKGDWIVIVKPDTPAPIITTIESVTRKSIAAYGISGQTTEVTWLSGANSWTTGEGSLSTIRETIVYCEPEELELAEEPIDTPIGKQEPDSGKKVDDRIELDGFYEDLESGRWVIVSGDRKIEGTSGVRSSELAMLSSVTQDIKQKPGEDSPDEKIHTFIKLAKPLEYTFKRDTVKIHGNVVKATHGETRREVLGSGDGSKGLQSFALKQKPLTHVAASNPTGVDSTLKVFVNDIQWHEAETLADRQPTDRNFITKTDNENITSIAFGNG
ncbi:MAG: putative baseplate assembly protein, partial [Candidatus Electrothrix sp. AUS1_2]|nr:putative baseplate assembly protein [Candidatus Electrothrix sp. AUS1_2]